MPAFTPHVVRWLAPIALVLLLTAAPVVAQPEEVPWVEPGLTLLPRSKAYMPWVFGGLFTVVVIAVSLKNPHRTHLD
ncbi:MAG: hypothetical protein AB7Q17_05605 [Phycisphaerae bacterium]